MVYHFVFFRAINRVAVIFALFFVLQGILFIIGIAGVLKLKLTFRFRVDIYGITGIVFIIYALVVYPALGEVLMIISLQLLAVYVSPLARVLGMVQTFKQENDEAQDMGAQRSSLLIDLSTGPSVSQDEMRTR